VLFRKFQEPSGLIAPPFRVVNFLKMYSDFSKKNIGLNLFPAKFSPVIFVMDVVAFDKRSVYVTSSSRNIAWKRKNCSEV
jgi:hypothetical protein